SVRYSINRNFDLWAIDVATRKLRQLTHGEGPEVSPRFSPDGRTIACLSVPRRGSHRDVFNLALVSLGGEKPTMRVLFDHHKGEKPSHLPPAFPLPRDCWDGDDHLVYSAETGVETGTIRIDIRTGKGEVKTKPRYRPELQPPPGNRFLADRHLGKTELIH